MQPVTGLPDLHDADLNVTLSAATRDIGEQGGCGYVVGRNSSVVRRVRSADTARMNRRRAFISSLMARTAAPNYWRWTVSATLPACRSIRRRHAAR